MEKLNIHQSEWLIIRNSYGLIDIYCSSNGSDREETYHRIFMRMGARILKTKKLETLPTSFLFYGCTATSHSLIYTAWSFATIFTKALQKANNIISTCNYISFKILTYKLYKYRKLWNPMTADIKQSKTWEYFPPVKKLRCSNAKKGENYLKIWKFLNIE